jgi:hypothetical protein
MALGVIDVHLGAFVKARRINQRALAIAPAVARRKAKQLDAANDPGLAIDAQLVASRMNVFLQRFGHGFLRYL